MEHLKPDSSGPGTIGTRSGRSKASYGGPLRRFLGTHFFGSHFFGNSDGGVTIYVTLISVLLLGFGGLVVDLGRLFTLQTCEKCLDPSIRLPVHRCELEERSRPRTPRGRRDLDAWVLVDADGLVVGRSGDFEARRVLSGNDARSGRALAGLAESIGLLARGVGKFLVPQVPDDAMDAALVFRLEGLHNVARTVEHMQRDM